MRRIIIASIFMAVLAPSAIGRSAAESAVATAPCSVDCARAAGEATVVPGCAPARPRASGTSVQTVVTVDGTRTYRLHVPPSYTGANAVPLILSIHGANSSATAQETYSGLSAKADAEGFIVAYPEGLPTANAPYQHFNAWSLPSPERDDLGFMMALIDSVEAQLCIDPAHVYSTGISNGAMMSVRLACSLSSRIAAVAPVAGAYYPPDALNLNPSELCPDTTAVPMIAFHGTADSIVPYNGGTGNGTNGWINYRLPLDDNTPAEDVMADWAAHNGCTAPRQESTIDTEVRLIQYGSCVNNATVELYAVDGGGHTWPGSFDVASLGYTTHQISATNLIWDFFAAHPAIPDADADGLRDYRDNCPFAANPDQYVTRRDFLDLHSIGRLYDDTTMLNSTTVGDACNDDIDGDGLSNDLEAELGPGGTGHSSCPGATANPDPLALDSDGDGFTDRAECLLGTDPNDSASAPPISYLTGDADNDGIPDSVEAMLGTSASSADSDGDKLIDGVEFLRYGSDPLNPNSDGDICSDGREAASFNDDTKVNSTDLLIVAKAQSIKGNPDYVADFDVTKDGKINSTDLLLTAKLQGTC